MKYCSGIVLMSLLGYSSLGAVSLDGTTGTSIYQAASYPFAAGDFARGFVRLNDGFSVPAGGTVSLNVLTPVASTINLNGTGAITLEGDLSLASNAVFAGVGGVIDGQSNVVFLNSDLTIPAGQTLSFSSDTIIDGQGHELILADGSPGGQLLVDGPGGTRLTLRNMTLRGVRTYTGGNALGFGASANQVLVLENVTLDLAGTFAFDGGALEVHNYNSIQGPFCFFYQAANNLTILPDSTLFIDMDSIFIYFPSDLNANRFVLSDATSRLYLNGCTFFVPKDTGLRLINGMLIVDNKTEFQSDGATLADKVIQFGNSNVNNDLKINILPAAQMLFTDAALRYQNIDTSGGVSC